MSISEVKSRFSKEFEAARELVREKYGNKMIEVIRAYRAEKLCSLDQAIFDLAEGAVAGDVGYL